MPRIDTYRHLFATYVSETNKTIGERANNSLTIADLTRRLAEANAAEATFARVLANQYEELKRVRELIRAMEDAATAEARRVEDEVDNL